jgi:dTDP-glucose pyrophosphorylase
MNWKTIKEEVLKNLDKAEIKNSEVRKTILGYERRVNSCRNFIMRGGSWTALGETKAYLDASDFLDDLNEGGNLTSGVNAKFWNEWSDYCKALEHNARPNANLGDWLA